jgi:hypothetical protein
MRHSCESGGCFYNKHVVKFDRWKGFFPRGINFTDIDQFLEYDFNFLCIDWKHPCKREPDKGQDIAYSRLARLDAFTVVIVSGDPETMTCEASMSYKSDGTRWGWVEHDISGLDQKILNWRKRIDDLRITD